MIGVCVFVFFGGGALCVYQARSCIDLAWLGEWVVTGMCPRSMVSHTPEDDEDEGQQLLLQQAPTVCCKVSAWLNDHGTQSVAAILCVVPFLQCTACRLQWSAVCVRLPIWAGCLLDGCCLLVGRYAASAEARVWQLTST